jgi:TPR repeat protein
VKNASRIATIASVFAANVAAQSLLDVGRLLQPPTIHVHGSNAVVISGSSITAQPSTAREEKPIARQDAIRSQPMTLTQSKPQAHEVDRDAEIEEIRRIEVGHGGVPSDVPRAFHRYTLAATKGNLRAHVEAGRLLLELNIPGATNKAHKHFEAAAAKGIADGLAWLAWLHDSKAISDWSHSKAFELYVQAAEKGSAWASFKLGVVFLRGALGKKADHALSVQWFSRAAELYYLPALVELWWLYEYGDSKVRNANRALDTLKMAARLGEKNALFFLGLKHRLGDGMPLDVGLAKANFERAANLGESRAQNELGVLLINAIGTELDTKAAIHWFRLSAAQGDANAMLNLGSTYETGNGVPLDKTAALQWYKHAADTGSLKGLTAYATMLMRGIGAKRDTQRALELLEKAYSLGSEQAAYEISRHFANDNDQTDWQKAELWVRRAAEKNHAEALNDLAAYVEQKKIAIRAGEDTQDLLKRASDAGSELGLVNYAKRLAVGNERVKKDADKAIALLSARVSSGSRMIKKELAHQLFWRGREADIAIAIRYAIELYAIDSSMALLLGRIYSAYPMLESKEAIGPLVQRLLEIANTSSSENREDAAMLLAWAAVSKRWDLLPQRIPVQLLHELSEQGNGYVTTSLIMLHLAQFKNGRELLETPHFSALLRRGSKQESAFKDFLAFFDTLVTEGSAVQKQYGESVATARFPEILEAAIKKHGNVGLMLAQTFNSEKGAPSLPSSLRVAARSGDLLSKALLCAQLRELKTVAESASEFEVCRFNE